MHAAYDAHIQLTGTVSHVFGQATLDSSYQEEREQIRESAQSSTDHFKAGLMGLSSGVFGGMTSILTQPYKGAQEYGFGVNKLHTGYHNGSFKFFRFGVNKYMQVTLMVASLYLSLPYKFCEFSTHIYSNYCMYKH